MPVYIHWERKETEENRGEVNLQREREREREGEGERERLRDKQSRSVCIRGLKCESDKVTKREYECV
jgi:hypothetical protein